MHDCNQMNVRALWVISILLLGKLIFRYYSNVRCEWPDRFMFWQLWVIQGLSSFTVQILFMLLFNVCASCLYMPVLFYSLQHTFPLPLQASDYRLYLHCVQHVTCSQERARLPHQNFLFFLFVAYLIHSTDSGLDFRSWSLAATPKWMGNNPPRIMSPFFCALWFGP